MFLEKMENIYLEIIILGDIKIMKFKSINEFKEYYFPNFFKEENNSKHIMVIIPRPSVRK